MYTRLIWLFLLFPVFYSSTLLAVPPESGTYTDYDDLYQDNFSRFYHIEIQGTTARLTIIAFNSVTGNPEMYVMQSELIDTPMYPGDAPHAPVFTDGYHPIHAFIGDLYRITNGACLRCFMELGHDRELVGRAGVWFDHLSLAWLQFSFHEGMVEPGSQSDITGLIRRNFGHRQLVIEDNSPGSLFTHDFIQHDLRGDWVFVDQAPDGPYREPVMRFNFTEVDIDPEPETGERNLIMLPTGTQEYTITYRDVARQAEFRCTPNSRVLGAKADGCELHQHGRVLFSARGDDLGIDRIHGFRGDLPLIVTDILGIADPWRRPETVIGVRIQPAPANLAPAGVTPGELPAARTMTRDHRHGGGHLE